MSYVFDFKTGQYRRTEDYRQDRQVAQRAAEEEMTRQQVEAQARAKEFMRAFERGNQSQAGAEGEGNPFLDAINDLVRPAALFSQGVFSTASAGLVPEKLSPQNRVDRFMAGAGDVAGGALAMLGAGQALKYGGRGLKTVGGKAADLFGRAPTAAKVAGAGAGVLGGREMYQGMTQPDIQDPNFLEQVGASLRAGTGDVLSTAGGAARWQGMEGVGDTLAGAGEGLRQGYETYYSKPIGWKSFLDPEFYSTTVARSAPFTAALIPAMVLGYKGAGAALGKTALSPFKKAILSAVGGAGLSRPLESALEAGGTYEEALALGMAPEDADKAANEVFRRTLALGGLDAAQLAAAFAPVPFRAATTAGRVGMGAGRFGTGALTEAGEEGYQEAIASQALGTDERSVIAQMLGPDAEAKQAMAVGAIFGGGMGGAGVVTDMVRAKVSEKTGVPAEQLNEAALDRMASDITGKKVIEEATQDVIAEIAQAATEGEPPGVQQPIVRDVPRESRSGVMLSETVPPPAVQAETMQQPAPVAQQEPVAAMPKAEAQVNIQPGDTVYGPGNKKLTVKNVGERGLVTVENEKGNQFKIGHKALRRAEEEAQGFEATTDIDQEAVNSFVDEALTSRKQFKTLPLRKVTAGEASIIKDLIGTDVAGYIHELSNYDLRHAIKKHGIAKVEAARKQVALTEDDLKRIPEIISSHDGIEKGSTKQGRKSVVYWKRINGEIFYVEVVLPKEGKLRSKTMWKKSTAVDHAAPEAPRHYTSEPDRSPTSSTTSNIRAGQTDVKQGENVKKEPRAFVRENKEKNSLEIRFAAKPSEETLSRLREAGFKWSKKKRMWHAENAPDRAALANELTGRQVTETAPAAEQVAAAEETQSFAGARQMKPKRGQKEMPPMQRRAIVKYLSEKLDIPIRVGRYQRRSALGVFKGKAEVIRTKLAEDIEVIAHEVGHYLDKQLGLSRRGFDDEMNVLAKDVKGDRRKEGVAQFMNFYLTDPTKAKARAPRYYEEFQTRLEQNPEIADILESAQAQIKTWLEQPSKARVLGSLSINQGTPKRPLTLDTFYTRAIDELRPLERAVKEITKGAYIDFKDNPFFKAWLTRGWRGKAETALRYGQMNENLEKIGPSLNEIITPVEKHLDDFRAYIVSKRSLELSGRDIETGIDPEDAKRTIQAIDNELGTDTVKGFDKAFRDLVRFQDYITNYLVKSGVLSADVAKSMREMNKDYVPFYRLFDDSVGTVKFRGKTFANLSSPVKRIKGSGRTIIDPRESIIKNTYAYINLAERNDVGRMFVELAGRFEGSGRWVEKVEAPKQAVKFKLQEVKSIFEEAGVNASQLDMEKAALVFKPGIFPAGKENIVTVYEDGKPGFYQFDPELYRAMLFLDKESTNILTKLLSVPASVLRAGATLTPEFMARNPVRDQFSAFVNSKYGFIPFVDLFRGISHVLKKDDLYWKWYQSGGAHSAFVSVTGITCRKT
ncbi:MAG: hypothetical protein MJA84_16300 [Firmicutes bacterium]|nr:hypothetical protein [Bacillota bacterium]